MLAESRLKAQSNQAMVRELVDVRAQATCDLRASQLCAFRAKECAESKRVVSREPVEDQEQARCLQRATCELRAG